MGVKGPTFPLVSRRRVTGHPLGSARANRRGPGLDRAGSRPYRPGDDFRLIDRHASARLSSLVGSDEFVVREHLTEEAVEVVVTVDRTPSMALFPAELPWLSKPAAAAAATALIADSARRARCPFAVVDPAGERAVDELAARDRPPRPGSFVFMVADFLDASPDAAVPGVVPGTVPGVVPGTVPGVVPGTVPGTPAGGWAVAPGRRFDVVPVVVQDPTWEQSFPDVAGCLLPFVDPATGDSKLVRLTRAEVAARRLEHERRLRSLLDGFAAIGLDWVLLGTSDPVGVLEAFVDWSAARESAGRLR